jgi:hypothetical protein
MDVPADSRDSFIHRQAFEDYDLKLLNRLQYPNSQFYVITAVP